MTQEKRKQIITLLNRGVKCISKISKDVGVSQLTVYRVRKRFEEQRPIQHQNTRFVQNNCYVRIFLYVSVYTKKTLDM